MASSPSEDPDHPAPPNRLIVLPTLNEEAGLRQTLAQIGEVRFRPGASLPGLAIIDGHSTDRTVAVAEEAGVTVVVQRGKGKGTAVREGLDWAVAEGYRSIAMMDADATYPARALPALFELLDSGRDLVVGVRRPAHRPASSLRNLVHRVGNGLLNYSAAQFSGQPVLDVCSGFWGVRAAAIPGLHLESDGFEIESELFIKAFRSGLRVAQFPVTYSPRVGTAKLHTIRDGSRILLSILRYSMRTARAEPPAAEPDGATPRGTDLQSMILSLSPERIVVLSAPDRIVEADGMARRLVAAVPQAWVVTAAWAGPPQQGAHPTHIPVLTNPGQRGRSLVVVALPPVAEDRSPEVLVGVPRTQRYFRVVPENGHAVPSDADAVAALVSGYREERIPHGRRGAWFILGATLEPSWSQRELALLGANAQATPFQVYRRDPGLLAVTETAGGSHPETPPISPYARPTDR